MEVDEFRGEKHEKINNWYFLVDLFWVVVPVFIVIYLCEEVSFWFYPLGIFIIANRYVAGTLVGHDGVHGLIHNNQKLNDFIGRYIFHFPFFISSSRYKAIHLLHHRYYGEKQDPDTFLHRDFPMPFGKYLWQNIVSLITLRTLYYYLAYYTELPKIILDLLGKKRSYEPKLVKSDIVPFIIFWVFALGLVHYFNFWHPFLLYWFVPIFVYLPIIQFHGALEHGALNFGSEYKVRSIAHPRWLVHRLIPYHIHYHYEHHINMRVPHYRLPAYSEYLADKNLIKDKDFRVSLGQALRQIFSY